MDANTGFDVFVCAGAIVLVANEVSASDRRDTLDALLYSQTVAARKVTDLASVVSWCHGHKMAMRITGTLLLDNPEVRLPVPTQGCFRLMELAKQVIHEAMPSSAVWGSDSNVQSQLDRTLATLASDVFQKHILHEGKWIRFMLSVLSPDLNLTTVMIAFEFDEPVVNHVLEHRFNTAKIVGNVSLDVYRALVDPEDYGLSRTTIISLLGERRQEQIMALA